MRKTVATLSSLATWAFVLAPASWAQSYNLVESPPAGDCVRVKLSMKLDGELKVTRDGKATPLKMSATASHDFVEKALESKSTSRRAARYYTDARSTFTVDTDKSDRTLSDNRRLIVAQRLSEPLTCYSPAGALSREELELVSEHFDTLSVVGLLPGKTVNMATAETSWKVESPVVQALCAFEGLISHDLTGKVTEVRDGKVHFTVAGKASGIDLGAKVDLSVAANCEYDVLHKRLVRVEWKQTDARDQGPASPAMSAETVTIVERAPLEAEPKELTSVALAGVPQTEDVPADLLKLTCSDAKGRFSLTHSRGWHTVARTDSHLILRLMDKGDMLAQATITPWKQAAAGQHMAPEQLRQVVAETPGWQGEEVLEDGEVTASKDRWVYRHAVRGSLEGTKVVQLFYLVAVPSGEQAVVSITMKPGQLSTVGDRDIALVNAIEFGRR